MTKQETFDIVAEHLIRQGTQATNGIRCIYHQPETGRKCAAGCLIPKDRYRPEMEGHSSDEQLVASILRELGHDIRLVSRLQSIHDKGLVRDWKKHLEELACDYGLEWKWADLELGSNE